MADTIFITVVLQLFVSPLFIPRFPLPAVIACLVLDAADQTIFKAKRAVHLDNSSPERELERDRLLSLGATTVAEFEHHTWMRDREGNDFCIIDE